MEGSSLAVTTATAAAGVLGLAWLVLRRRVSAPRKPALNVLVIGGRTGIGAALAREMETLGNRVLVASRGSELVCNVRDAESVKVAITSAQERLGSVDLLVHVAAIPQPHMASLRDTPRDDIREVVETNVLGTLNVAREAALLLAPGANVVLCGGAGTSSERVTVGYATYAFTKGGLRQLTKTLHHENRDRRIGFHLIVPGERFPT
jgi:3-oxoacyl-[acyl-carrier protein] reductase